MRRGYILAGFDREQVMQDKAGGRSPAQEAYPGFDWGAVRVWAWAQSLLADYLLTREDVDREAGLPRLFPGRESGAGLRDL